MKTDNMVSEQVRHKPVCTVEEDDERLESLDLESRDVAKTMALISLTATAKLICAFAFAYAKRWFSH